MPDLPQPTLRCNKCGQGMQVIVTDQYNLLSPQFCPICGTKSLAKQTHVIGMFDTRCYLVGAAFHNVNPQLVQLMYQNWRYFDAKENKHVKQPHRFIDYLKEQLES